MHRYTIRNLNSRKAVKPHVFDVVYDGEEFYFEVKVRDSENEVVSLTHVIDQISEAKEHPLLRGYRRKRPENR